MATPYPVDMSRCSWTPVRACHALMQGSDLENDLGAPKCVHVCVQALKCARAHAHTHSHTNVLFILLFIHQPIPTRQKGRLRIAWLNNNRTTCLNIGRVITDTIPNFSLWGFLNTLESTLGFPLFHASFTRTFSGLFLAGILQPCEWMLICLHTLSRHIHLFITWIHSHILSTISCF